MESIATRVSAQMVGQVLRSGRDLSQNTDLQWHGVLFRLMFTLW